MSIPSPLPQSLRHFCVVAAVAALGLPMQAQAGEGTVSSADSSDWFAPYKHHHFSSIGTPVVHSFNIEPAFTGRDLFGTYRYRSGNDAIEHETELELEWGITRRFGVILELPYIIENDRTGPTERGFGDLVIVPRALIHESDRLLVTVQTEIGLPTGDESFGQETAIVPGIAAWYDLGNWWTVQGLVGLEHNFDGDETACEFGFGLIKSIDLNGDAGECDHGHHRTHAGLLNFHFEITGEVGMNGAEDGKVGLEGLVGVSHGLACGLDLRVGYELPLTNPDEFDYGLVFGANWHF